MLALEARRLLALGAVGAEDGADDVPEQQPEPDRGQQGGEEVHEDIDQILTFVSGTGKAIVSGSEKAVAQGDLVVVPAGKKHNFVNTGANPLILYTVYGPPEHADGAVHKTKEEADRLEEEGKDEPPTE